MACAHPFKLYDKDTREYIGQAPCGRCINCLVDRRNSIDDLCQEELYQRNFCASYLTVTYDDFHLDWRDNWHGKLVPSINKNDAIKFVKRIRSYMDYHKIDSPILQKDFRYICCAEYGEDGSRPHLHFVFFGLDYRAAANMFRECWKYGLQKLLPVKNGCFRYLLKYLTKQVHMLPKAKDKYECYNIERPFFHHSVGLGKALFKRQWNFIKEHDYCYKSRKGVLRPIPQYYKKRYELINYDSHRKEKEQLYKTYYTNEKTPFSLKKYNDFKKQLAKTQEAALLAKFRNTGEQIPSMYFLQGFFPDWFKKYQFGNSAKNEREFLSASKDLALQCVTGLYGDKLNNYKECMSFFDSVNKAV